MRWRIRPKIMSGQSNIFCLLIFMRALISLLASIPDCVRSIVAAIWSSIRMSLNIISAVNISQTLKLDFLF